jgi:hypothetical protein
MLVENKILQPLLTAQAQNGIRMGTTHTEDTMSTEIYTPTNEFNGMKASRRRQALTVIEGRRINNGKLFPNRDVVGRVTLEGKRGARYDGFVNRSGTITVLN